MGFSLNWLLRDKSDMSVKLEKIFFLWRPCLKDPKDDLVLEVAVKSQCEYIITFNKKDFVGSEKFGIEVVTPYEFMTMRGLL